MTAPTLEGNTLGRMLTAGAGTIKGDREWQDWTPTVTAVSGAFVSTTVGTAKFREDVGIVFFEVSITITNQGTAATGVQITLPRTPAARVHATGSEAGVTGKMLTARWNATSLLVLNYDGTNPIVNNAIIALTGWYRT
jgi:hypothetical protein